MDRRSDEETPTFTLDDINHAFDDDEFCFYLQPKCNAVTGAIVGMEALVRWNHPKYGVITPDKFIPLLGQAKTVTRFDFHIWRSVCEMLACWQREGRNTVPVSVNVSMTDIDAVDVARTLGDMLDRYGVDPGLLQVEITESAIAQNFDVVSSTIHDLHECGIVVLMDDFGSAYSSLNMLKDINVEAIKLDMKFLDLNSGNEAKGLKIVEAVIDMAYQLRIGVIAEGAQTAQQVNQLRELGCIYIQGYFFFKPLTVEQAEDLLEKRSDCHRFWNISRDLRQKDYRKSHNGRALLESSSVAIEQAEREMRTAKKTYYAQNGNRRRARMLNEKLEGILVHSRIWSSCYGICMCGIRWPTWSICVRTRSVRSCRPRGSSVCCAITMDRSKNHAGVLRGDDRSSMPQQLPTDARLRFRPSEGQGHGIAAVRVHQNQWRADAYHRVPESEFRV